MSSGIIFIACFIIPDQYIQRFLIDVCCITCSSYAVMTDPQDNRKSGIWDEAIVWR